MDGEKKYEEDIEEGMFSMLCNRELFSYVFMNADEDEVWRLLEKLNDIIVRENPKLMNMMMAMYLIMYTYYKLFLT